MNAFAIINKPLNLSSSDVVIRCRNAVSKAINSKIKCGHMGTLDPMASGVLLVAFGNATRLFDFLLEKQKGYSAEFVFGEERDTLDSTGICTGTANYPKYVDIEQSIPKLCGIVDQIPPKFSAVNINGKRAYDLARKGEDFEIKAKKVVISSIEITDKTLDSEYCRAIKLDIQCGGGTYIRSICRDLAYMCNSLGYMSSLVRTGCGGFELSESTTLENFLASPLDYLKPTELLLSKIMNIVDLSDFEYKKIRNGQSIATQYKDGNYGARYNNKLAFIIKVENNIAKSICFLED